LNIKKYILLITATQTIVNRMALGPKITPDMIKAGKRAINTSSMIRLVLILSIICGEGETIRLPGFKRPIIYYLLP
jgi:hypothetical protein